MPVASNSIGGSCETNMYHHRLHHHQNMSSWKWIRRRSSMIVYVPLLVSAFLLGIFVLGYYRNDHQAVLLFTDTSTQSLRQEALMRSKSSLTRFEDLRATDEKSFSVAFAIPVGGRTQRLDRLQSLLHDLVAGGAGRSNVFIFEDDGSRDAPSASLRDIARLWGVHLIQSGVKRGHEPSSLFGLYLARHYHYMMDTILLKEEDVPTLTSKSEVARHYGYDFMVILEDDLHLAPDAVKFFHAMAAVMQQDDTLLCVCAHADNAFFAATNDDKMWMQSHHRAVRPFSSKTNSNSVMMNIARVANVSSVDSPPASLSVTRFGSHFAMHRADANTIFDQDIDVVLQEFESALQMEVNAWKLRNIAESNQRFRHHQNIGNSLQVMMSADDFDFRRGQHFMAPGWMTSARVYRNIRHEWFDDELNLPLKEKLNMPNGNWDAFMDSQAFHHGLECIYPEVPRIAHQGANGYTVTAQAQAELFDNLRLSTLPYTIDYGDLSRLVLDNYDTQLMAYMASCKRVHTYDEINLYRRSSLCLFLPTSSDKDSLFVELFSGHFGMVSVGGHANYGKQRGVHHGGVFTRWMTNLILVVGAHGKLAPFFLRWHEESGEQAMLKLLHDERTQVELPIRYRERVKDFFIGCYADDREQRLLSVHLNSMVSVRPVTCFVACQLRGFKYSGVQWGWECWCGNAPLLASYQKLKDSECNSKCVSSWEEKMAEEKLRQAHGVSNASLDQACGGDLRLSILSSNAHKLQQDNAIFTSFVMMAQNLRSVERLNDTFSDLTIVVAEMGANCDEACVSAGSDMRCVDALLAVLHNDCPRLQALLGCFECDQPATPWEGFASPGIRGGVVNASQKGLFARIPQKCILSRGKYLRCSAKPPDAQFQRACVCVKS